MASKESQNAVRPLPVRPHRPPPPGRIPAVVAIALVAIGASAGYLLGLPNDTVGSAAPSTTAAPATAPGMQPTPAHYDWLEQQPTSQDAWAVFAAVELGDYLYLLVANDPESPLGRSLWRSRDGAAWDLVELAFGPGAVVTDLDTYNETLLLSGWKDKSATLWQSQLLPQGETPRWTAATLPTTQPSFGDLAVGGRHPYVTSEINSEGEIVVAMHAGIDLTNTLLDLLGGGATTSLLDYPELPEVVVADSRLWMRIVNSDGTESVHTESIPATLRITPAAGRYGIDVAPLDAGALWTSTDGDSFVAVDLSALPVAPVPRPFNDIFVSTVAGSDGGSTLWISASGHTWSPSGWVPPAECGGWQGVAIGDPGLLLASDEFDTLCRSGNGTDWEVRHSTTTQVTSTTSVWIEGGRTGYLALAQNSVEHVVLTSNDGFTWDRVESTPEVLGSRTFRIGDRLVTTARRDRLRPQPEVVWVGKPS